MKEHYLFMSSSLNMCPHCVRTYVRLCLRFSLDTHWVTIPLPLFYSLCVILGYFFLLWMCFVTWQNSQYSLIFHIFLFALSSFLQVFCPLLLYPNLYGVLFFQLQSTNNVWSSQHQGCCHRVAMATPSPRSNGHCGENGEAETERAHTHTHTRRHTTVALPPPHGQPLLICFNSQWEC